MTDLRLRSIDVEAFRGFAAHKSIPLDADAVIVEGANGSGKTSLVDALCWVLTGRLPRLERHRRHLNDELIMSNYAQSSSATVALQISLNAVDWTIKRSGSSRGSTLSIHGPERTAQASDPETQLSQLFGFEDSSQLRGAVDRWVLRQDEVRAVLEASPNDLHERLKEILSLDVLDDFQDSLDGLARERAQLLKERTTAVESAQKSVATARAALAQIEAKMQASGDLEPALQQLEATLKARASSLVLRIGRSDLALMPTALSSLRATYEEIRSGAEHIRRSLAELSLTGTATQDQLSEARKRLVTAQAAATEGAKRLAGLRDSFVHEERRATAEATLASIALPLLGDTCPVCAQPIDADHVAAALRERLSKEGSLALEKARVAYELAATEQLAIDRAVQASLDAEQVSVTAIARRTSTEAALSQAWSAIQVAATNDYFELPLLADRREETLDESLSAVVDVGQALRAVVSAAQLASTADLRAQAENGVAEAEEGLTRARAVLEAAARESKEASDLSRATQQAIVRVVGRAMESVNPSFSEVYRRLAPHPTFTDLAFEHDYYRLKGRSMPVVIDPLWEVTANPAIVCSVGQLNVVALSYFLAFAMASPASPMPFVVLDDPLQSLDDVNALGFADFCRRIKRDRQVVITTHDRRFGALLRRKLSPRTSEESALGVTMAGWDRDGPNLLIDRIEAPTRFGATA